MKIKQVNRYYCDFCKKSGCSKPAMEKHEKHCTMNPNRICRMCLILEVEQQPISDLVMLLPAPKDFKGEDEAPWTDTNPLVKAVNASMKSLRDATSDCPACILSALRQRGISVPMASSFKFKEECDEIWAEQNLENSQG
jgi:hypothetical protein